MKLFLFHSFLTGASERHGGPLPRVREVSWKFLQGDRAQTFGTHLWGFRGCLCPLLRMGFGGCRWGQDTAVHQGRVLGQGGGPRKEFPSFRATNRDWNWDGQSHWKQCLVGHPSNFKHSQILGGYLENHKVNGHPVIPSIYDLLSKLYYGKK